MVQSPISSFDHIFELPTLHLQFEIKWNLVAANLELRSLDQGFHCPLDCQDQNLMIVDF